MNCEQFNQQLDDYLDGGLAASRQQALQAHADYCSGCAESLAERRQLLQAMKTLPLTPMREGFAQQALRRATEQRSHQRRGFVKGFGSALVAGLAIWATTLVMMPNPLTTPANGVGQITLALHQERTVNLVFDAPAGFEDAMLSLNLPENVEVIGFPGQSHIACRTSLSQGRNVLPLPLKANSLADAQIVASIESGQSKKTFQVSVGVSEKASSNVAIAPADLV